jgi:hypothetical protein
MDSLITVTTQASHQIYDKNIWTLTSDTMQQEDRENQMGGTCSMNDDDKNSVQKLQLKNLKEIRTWGDFGMYQKILLK